MKKSHKTIIKDYLRSIWLENPELWVVGFKMEGKELNGNFSSCKAGTRCRDLVKDGEIERSYSEEGYAQYRYLPIPAEVEIIEAKEARRLEDSQLKLI